MLYVVTFTINIPPMLAYIPYMDPMGKTSSVQACCSQVFLNQYGMWTWDVDRIKQMPVHQFQMIQVGVHTRKRRTHYIWSCHTVPFVRIIRKPSLRIG